MGTCCTLTLADMEENEAKRREVVKRKKHMRSRGLSFEDAEEVIKDFNKVAVMKQRVSTQEQVSVWKGPWVGG